MIPVFRNETEAIQKMKQKGKSFFIRNKFYFCISGIGKRNG